MAKTLDDAGLDLIFRTARTYNGYTDEPVTEDRAARDLGSGEDGADIGQPVARADRLVRVSDEAKAKLAALASEANAAKILQGTRHRDHRHGP